MRNACPIRTSARSFTRSGITPAANFTGKLRDFFRRHDTTDAADHELFVTRVNDAAARILDVLADDARQLAHRQTGIAQPVDLRLHHNLFHITAVSVDLGDPGDGAQLRFDDVFLNLPELHQLRFTRRRCLARTGFVIDRVVENFAEPG